MLSFRICRVALASLAGALSLLAQAPGTPAPAAKPTGPDDVVAMVEGEKITPARLKQLRESLPPQFRQTVEGMDDKAFLKSYAGLLVMSRLAEQEKIAEHEPLRSQYAFLRMNFLAQVYLDHLNKSVTPSEQELQLYYDQHKADFEEAQVRAIYVAFSPNAGKQADSDPPAKKPLTEEQAKAKAEALVEQLGKGADFAKLARENSDDATTAEKGGDAGSIKRGASGVPQELIETIFASKEGEVSKAIRQPAGFYIVKVEKFRTVPYDEAIAQFMPTARGLKVKQEVDRIMKSAKIDVVNEGFFGGQPGH